MKTRKWNGETKFAIVMEGLRGVKPVAEICREHQISQTQYYKWRDKFLEGGKHALTNGQRDDVPVYEQKIETLEKIIGKLTIENATLKKTDALFGRRS